MTIDTTTPRTRRAIILGALGGALASAAALVHPPESRAADGDNLILGQSNDSSAQTELLSTSPSGGIRVVGGDIALQGWGESIGVDAYGGTIGLNAVADGDTAPAVVAYNRANSTGLLGLSTDGNESSPTVPAKTGVYGLAEQDVNARGVFGKSTSGQGVRGEATTGIGVAAVSDSGTGVTGSSNSGVGVRGSSLSAAGVYGASPSAVGVLGVSGGGTIPDPIAASTGVYGLSEAGHGVYGASDTGVGVYAANNASTLAAIVAEGGPGTAIHGHGDAGPVPASPASTGIYGSAILSGTAIAADSALGLAVKAVSSSGNAIRGRGLGDGVIGESASGRSGIVGYSGAGSAPAGPAKTGVYGEATQDSASRGVSGFALAGQGVRGDSTTGQGVAGVATTGQGVKGTATTGDAVLGQSTSGKSVHGVATTGQGVVGEATTGTGVRAAATTGLALDVAGIARFSRSGRVSVPINRSYVDVTVAGGLASTAMVFAMLQYPRSGVYVISARPNYPSAGKVRIYLNKVASTTATTALAWVALG